MRLASAVGATVLRGVAWGRERREGLKLRPFGSSIEGQFEKVGGVGEGFAPSSFDGGKS